MDVNLAFYRICSGRADGRVHSASRQRVQPFFFVPDLGTDGFIDLTDYRSVNPDNGTTGNMARPVGSVEGFAPVASAIGPAGAVPNERRLRSASSSNLA